MYCMTRKIVLFCVFAVSVFILSGCSSPVEDIDIIDSGNEYDAEPYPGMQCVTRDECQFLAERAVRESYQYRQYNGNKLTFVSYDAVKCPSCYTFYYLFDIDARVLPDDVYGYRADVHIIAGNIRNTAFKALVYDIAEISDVKCTLDTDCNTPPEYLIRSSCPFTSICYRGNCTVVCRQIAHSVGNNVQWG